MLNRRVMPMPANTIFNHKHKRQSHERGFTLIELVVTIVVMAISFTALGVWMFNANAGSADPVISMRAATLGQAYVEEVLSKRFDENTSSGGIPRCNEVGQPACSGSMGADAGETRSTYDDVDDYNGLNEVPTDAFGNARANYTGFNVSVVVRYAGSDFGLTNTELKKIDVTVTTPSGSPHVFAAYRGNF